MKKPSLFTLSVEAVNHLEAAIAYFKRVGHKATKTDLVERAIFTIPTSEDQKKEGLRQEKTKPVPPLLSAYRSWRSGKDLTRSQLLFLAEQAHTALKRHQGVYEHEYVADLLRAFKGVLATKPKQGILEQSNSLTSYYLSNLVEHREGGLEASLNASIVHIMEPTFAGSADFPARNLVVALRDEPPLDEKQLNTEIRPYLGTIFKLAIRQHFVESGNPFLDPDSQEPSNGEYWSSIHKSSQIESAHFSLHWGADHKTAGARFYVASGESRLNVQFKSFTALGDFFALLKNISKGGAGGSRGEVTLEKSPDFGEPLSAAQLSFGKGMVSTSLSLSEAQLNELEEFGGRALADDKISTVCEELTWVYGDI